MWSCIAREEWYCLYTKQLDVTIINIIIIKTKMM
jgi:hypothetical protein